MTTVVKENASLKSQPEEQILVVKRSDLFEKTPAWSGLKEVDFGEYLDIIQIKKEFMPRSAAEQDFQYKQIIPYLVFKHNNKFFLMQRSSTSSEQRLQSKFSLGIGGHIRQEDMEDDSLFGWAKREFHEEVSFDGELEIKPMGILNDDSNDVGKVHIGFVFLLTGSSADISIKSELKSGELLTVDDMQPFFTKMESWSQMVFEFIVQHKL